MNSVLQEALEKRRQEIAYNNLRVREVRAQKEDPKHLTTVLRRPLRLSEEQCRSILRLRRQGWTIRELATLYKTCKFTIGRVINKRGGYANFSESPK